MLFNMLPRSSISLSSCYKWVIHIGTTTPANPVFLPIVNVSVLRSVVQPEQKTHWPKKKCISYRISMEISNLQILLETGMFPRCFFFNKSWSILYWVDELQVFLSEDQISSNFLSSIRPYLCFVCKSKKKEAHYFKYSIPCISYHDSLFYPEV